MVYKYVPLFVFSLFLFADCVAQSWTSILVIRSSLNFIQVDLYCNCGEVLITSRDILTSIALFQRVRGDSQGVEGLMHLHAYIPIAVSQAHTLRTWACTWEWAIWCWHHKGGQKSSSSSRASDSSEGRGQRAKAGAIRTGVSSCGEDESGHWSCEHCTYAKTTSTSVCIVCSCHQAFEALDALKIHQICQGNVHSNHKCLCMFPQVNSIGRAISCVLNLHCK